MKLRKYTVWIIIIWNFLTTSSIGQNSSEYLLKQFDEPISNIVSAPNGDMLVGVGKNILRIVGDSIFLAHDLSFFTSPSSIEFIGQDQYYVGSWFGRIETAYKGQPLLKNRFGQKKEAPGHEVVNFIKGIKEKEVFAFFSNGAYARIDFWGNYKGMEFLKDKEGTPIWGIKKAILLKSGALLISTYRGVYLFQLQVRGISMETEHTGLYCIKKLITVPDGESLNVFPTFNDSAAWMIDAENRILYYQPTGTVDTFWVNQTRASKMDYLIEWLPGRFLILEENNLVLGRSVGDSIILEWDNPVFNHQYIKSLTLDQELQIWAGTFKGELYKIPLFPFARIKKIPGGELYGLLADADGGLWRANAQGLWYQADETKEAVQLTNQAVRGLLMGPEGRIWFWKDKRGLGNYDPDTRIFSDFSNAFLPDYVQVNCIAFDYLGRPLLGTSSGIWYYDQVTDQWRLNYRFQPAFQSLYPISNINFMQREGDTLLVGTNTAFMVYVRDSLLVKKTVIYGVASAVLTREGVWYSSHGAGINFLDLKNHKEIQFPNYSLSGYTLVNAKRGNSLLAVGKYDIWLIRSVQEGLSLLPLMGKENLGQKHVARNPKGGFYLANQESCISLPDLDLIIDRMKIKVSLDSIRLNNKHVSLNNIVGLPGEIFKVYFSGTSLRFPKEIRYQVSFSEPGTIDWEQPSKISNYLLKPGIPGNYELKIKSIDVFGQESEVLTFPVSIMPPYWMRWWVIVLFIFFLALSVVLTFRWNNRRLLKRRAVLESIVRKRTNELEERTRELEVSHDKVDFLNSMLAESLRSREEDYQALIEALPDLLMVLDENGLLVRAGYRMYHPISPLLMGKKGASVSDLFSNDIALRFQVAIKLAHIEDEIQSFDFQLTLNDKPYFFEARSRYVNHNKEILFLIRDVTERTNMRLKEQEREKEMVKQAIAIQERERQMISFNLHDQIGFLLTTIKNNIREVRESNYPLSVSSLQYGLNRLENNLKQIEHGFREAINNISPRILEDCGLEDALVDLIQKLNIYSPPEIKLWLPSALPDLDREVELSLFRIVMESINNARKYAGANQISVQLSVDNGNIYLMVEDDGKGFDPGLKTKGHGLRSIEHRAQAYGGIAEIETGLGKGTVVCVEFPLDN